MACRTSAEGVLTGGDPQSGAGGGAASALLNNTRRIGELKKKLVLAEGQRKAYTGDWTQRDKQTADALGDLKKDIKRLTGQLVQQNNANRSRASRPATSVAGASTTLPLSTQLAVRSRKSAPNAGANAAASDDAATAAAAASQTTPIGCAYPVGARTAADAVHICDLQHIQSVKRLDLLTAQYAKRVQHFDRLYERYQELQMTTTVSSATASGPATTADNPAAAADVASTSAASTSAAAPQQPASAAAITSAVELTQRQRIAHLENDVHRTHVQWMEAEHIRKKYRSIAAALRSDAERFERKLGQLERAQGAQDADIEGMQRTHCEAQLLRDGTKVTLMRQEHSVLAATRSRDRQAQDCRRQVEERRAEMERLERRLFAVTATTTAATGLASAGIKSAGAAGGAAAAAAVPSTAGGRPSSGDEDAEGSTTRRDRRGGAATVAVRRLNSAERRQQQQLQQLQLQFKRLMEQTGATSPPDVLQRYVAQRESSTRLAYLRSVAETEKQQLERSRERMAAALDASKFAAVKDTDENQDEVEQLKRELAGEDTLAAAYAEATEHSGHVIDAVQQTLLDLILKLQEVDEIIEGAAGGRRTSEETDEVDFELADLLSGNVDDVQLLRILEDRFRKGIAWCDDQHIVSASGGGVDTDEAYGGTTGDGTVDVDALRLDDLLLASPTVSRPATSALDERERPQPFPSCYSNLMAAGRLSSSVGAAASIGHMGGGVSVTPGQLSQSAATDDEAEVPSRGFIKRQAQSIVDAKSRRKGFRAPKR